MDTSFKPEDIPFKPEDIPFKPKIAICYFGMTRSTRFVYSSHQQYLYNIFAEHK